MNWWTRHTKPLAAVPQTYSPTVIPTGANLSRRFSRERERSGGTLCFGVAVEFALKGRDISRAATVTNEPGFGLRGGFLLIVALNTAGQPGSLALAEATTTDFRLLEQILLPSRNY